jgi:hypothetical protein
MVWDIKGSGPTCDVEIVRRIGKLRQVQFMRILEGLVFRCSDEDELGLQRNAELRSGRQ